MLCKRSATLALFGNKIRKQHLNPILERELFMKKSILLILLAVVVFCTFIGCRNTPTEPATPSPTSTPTPTPEPTPEPTPTIVYLTFEVINNAAPYAIDELQFSSTADEALGGEPLGEISFEEISWGDDLLGEGTLGSGRNRNSVELTLISDSEADYVYSIRLLDDEGDEFFFRDADLGDCARIVISWDFSIRRYIADLYDESELLYAEIESVSSEANTFETIVPLSAHIDAEAVVEELELAVHYPSKAFQVSEIGEDFVRLTSSDGKAVFEVTSNELWNAPDRVYFSVQRTRYTNTIRTFVNDKLKTEGATDIKWHDMVIEDSRYEGIWQLIYVYGHVDYTLDEVPMHTVCRVDRWARFSDYTLFLYTTTLSVPIDDLEFYMEHYFYKIMLGDYVGDD